jgi:hypothetical protein
LAAIARAEIPRGARPPDGSPSPLKINRYRERP